MFWKLIAPARPPEVLLEIIVQLFVVVSVFCKFKPTCVPAAAKIVLESLKFTVSLYTGLAVPIPTFPAFVTTKLVAVEEPMTNEGAAPLVPVGLMENCPHGEVEPRDIKPVEPV